MHRENLHWHIARVAQAVRDAGRNGDARASGQRLTRGTTSQVAVSIESGEMCFVSPPILFERLGVERPQ